MRKIKNLAGVQVPLILLLLFITSRASAGDKGASSCDGQHTKVNWGTDDKGCFFTVEFQFQWDGLDWDPGSVPTLEDCAHGFKVVFTGATITADPEILPPVSGVDWFKRNIDNQPTPNAARRNPDYLTSHVSQSPVGTNTVWWIKEPKKINQQWPHIYPNAFAPDEHTPYPGPQTVTVKIRVSTTASTVVVDVYGLEGWAWTLGPEHTFCQQSHPFDLTPPTYSIVYTPDPICSPRQAELSLSPPPVLSSALDFVHWYYWASIPPDANAACPSTDPWDATQWIPMQGSASGKALTHVLTQTTCFACSVKSGCYMPVVVERKIEACPGPPSTGIKATPASGYTDLVQGRACDKWSGRLTLDPSVFPCATQVLQWYARSGPTTCTGMWLPVSGSANKTWIDIGLPETPSACVMNYCYKAVLKNVCNQQAEAAASIFIDRKPIGGTIQAMTNDYKDVGEGDIHNPQLCIIDGDTRLQHTTTCGTPAYWQYKEEQTPCQHDWEPDWHTLDNSNTSNYWTNPLTKSTLYRVVVENGVCLAPINSTPSQEIIVDVTPPLTVSIQPPTPQLLCANPILTATTGPFCYYSLQYQWFRDGLPVTGWVLSNTYQPTGPGKYKVVVRTDPDCQSAESNTVLVCRPSVSIAGPCCICVDQQGQPTENVTLSAAVQDICGWQNLTYLWSPDGQTTSSISVGPPLALPKTYTVTVTAVGSGCQPWTSPPFVLKACP